MFLCLYRHDDNPIQPQGDMIHMLIPNLGKCTVVSRKANIYIYIKKQEKKFRTIDAHL